MLRGRAPDKEKQMLYECPLIVSQKIQGDLPPNFQPPAVGSLGG